jgi:cell division protein FtsI/penicillin-binding protein 2
MTDRIWLLAVLFVLVMATFWARLIDLQLVQGERLAKVPRDVIRSFLTSRTNALRFFWALPIWQVICSY